MLKSDSINRIVGRGLPAWLWVVVAAGCLPAQNLPAAPAAPEARVNAAYTAWQFAPEEGWHMAGAGPLGAAKLEGKKWELDFTQGATWIALRPPDRCLLGTVDKIRLRVRGAAKGHPVQLRLHTHFMTFHKVLGEFAGEGEQELVVEAPPGPGWEWSGGENDGKLHGPLRVAEIRVEAGRAKDRCTLECISLLAEVHCPPAKRFVLVAGAREREGKTGFEASLRGLGDTAAKGTLKWLARDWDGRELGAGQQEVTVPPRAEPATVWIPAPAAPGRKFIETEFRWELPGQETAPAQACWLAAPEPHGDAQLLPESPFGMGIYLGRSGGEDRERVAQAAQAAGVKWSREDVSWARLEPRKGEYDWTFTDGLLDCARRHGITIYPIIMGWPGWTQAYTAAGVEDYARFLKVMVARYKKELKYWEIWNEPNIFFWQGPRELYATLLTKSHAAIKEVDPEAQVLGLSTAGIDYQFISQMLALKTPFDILTIHPYRQTLVDREFIADLKKVSDLVRLPSGARRPVWLTEMGWATFTPHNTLKQDFQPNSLRTQATLIARSYLCSIVSGVEPRTFWYDFRNDGEDPLYFEHNMGIVYRDFRPKPAGQAYATLTRLLKGKALGAPINLGNPVFAHRFVNLRSGEQTIAVWNPAADGKVTVPMEGEFITVWNAMGETRPLVLLSDAGKSPARLEIELKQGAPVYITSTLRPVK